jgi:hypothetical protein
MAMTARGGQDDAPRKIETAAEVLRKASNPKDVLGIRKVPRSVIPVSVLWELGDPSDIPAPVIWELAVAMFEGALKYARHNYRAVGVRASVYFDALNRHVDAWWDGQDIDPDSGLHHITKAIATLFVLRDSMIRGNWVDDRAPRTLQVRPSAVVVSDTASGAYSQVKNLMDAWWEGQESVDGMNTVAWAILELIQLRARMIYGKLQDDRHRVHAPKGFLDDINKRIEALLEKYPNPKQPFTQLEFEQGSDRVKNPGESVDAAPKAAA